MSHKSPCLCLSSVNIKGERIASPAEALLSDCMVLENLSVLDRIGVPLFSSWKYIQE